MSRTRRLTHVDARGRAAMVDVASKPVTLRRASASAIVDLGPDAFAQLQATTLKKGDALAVAKVAGIQAAKRASDLIPLCHGLAPDHVDVAFALMPPNRIEVRSIVSIRARTGVEMEALTAVSVAALTLYDMCKSVNKGIVIGPIQLEAKSGGRSGSWRRRK